MLVRDRRGRTRTVIDGYVLQDGEGVVVGMMTMDAALPTGEVDNSRAGSQSEYDQRISNAWRQPNPSTVPEVEKGAMQPAGSQSDYERRITEAWRGSS